MGRLTGLWNVRIGKELGGVLTGMNHTISAMAALLHPTLRLRYFHEHWTGELKAFIPEVQTACHNHWKRHYLANKSTDIPIPKKRTLLEAFPYKPMAKDEFDLCLSQDPTTMTTYPLNPFQWYFDCQE